MLGGSFVPKSIAEPSNTSRRNAVIEAENSEATVAEGRPMTSCRRLLVRVEGNATSAQLLKLTLNHAAPFLAAAHSLHIVQSIFKCLQS